MSDALVLGVFKELAVLRKLRTADGSWGETSQPDFVKTLRQAMRMVGECQSAVAASAEKEN